MQWSIPLLNNVITKLQQTGITEKVMKKNKSIKLLGIDWLLPIQYLSSDKN
tara:strand:+ start:335 stop:487 length:153 start_codon:yes stop_codon:yes gene_type:complete